MVVMVSSLDILFASFEVGVLYQFLPGTMKLYKISLFKIMCKFVRVKAKADSFCHTFCRFLELGPWVVCASFGGISKSDMFSISAFLFSV